MCSGDKERLREGNRVRRRDDVRGEVRNGLGELERSGKNRRQSKI
jgi:hypothetical protein